MVLFLSERDVRNLLTMQQAIDIVAAAFRDQGEGKVTLLPRFQQALPGTAGALRMLSAVLPESSFFGVKTLTGLPGKRLDGEVYFVVLLFDTASGALRAVISANYLTGVRTGAASGVAARLLAKPAASRLAVLGSGAQAWYQVQAMCAVRPVASVFVHSLRQERATAFAARIERELGVKARALDNAQEAVSQADLVVTATTASDPVVRGAWLQPGAHVSAIGANTRGKRELDVDCFRRGRLVVDSREQVMEETGDMLDAISQGLFAVQQPILELSNIVGQSGAGRQSAQEITLFKSVGVALQDVAVAAHVLEAAKLEGCGTWLQAEAAD